MQDEKPEQSALLWKKAAAFLASVLLLSVLVFYISGLAPEIRWYHITETAWKNDARREERGPKKNWD